MKTFGSLFPRTALALAVALLSTGSVFAQQQAAAKPAAADEEGAPRAKDDNVRLGTITIVGEGNKLGAGQILNEDAAKSRSTVTRSATEKDRATGNSYQALALLPGINSFNHDATGLFGGGLTVRGFGADQLGFTVNGVPVNDSGNFAVYPQEYADGENLCTQSVTQGSPDVESPHAGATGGNVGITSCDPENKRRFRVSQTLGDLSLIRSFLRYDTGRFADNKLKMFFSFSHTEADKWKGEGRAKKDHFDAAFRWDLSEDNKVLGSVLYNRAINNNIATLSLAQIASRGYFADFGTTFPGHLPAVNGTRQDENTIVPNPQFYKLSLNPFENAIASLSGSFKLADATYLKVQPYLWYGFGNGGVQQRVHSETDFLNTTTGTVNAGVDLNGDGDTLDRIIVARSSVTRTMRPGVTTEVNTTLGAHQIRAGVWFERASHRQTQPLVPVDNFGNMKDVWLQDGRIQRPDGSFYQGRNWDTVSTAYQAYVSDAISFMDEAGLLTLGVRMPHVKRDVSSLANESFTTPYNLTRTYKEALPQIGVRFFADKSSQVFLTVAKNFRAPPNFAFTGNNVRLVNGKVELLREAKPETSVMTDLGYRLQTKSFSLSASLFNSDFKDRQGNAYDDITQTSTYQNIGRINNRGLELEFGSASFNGFTAYGSLTLQRSRVKDDYAASATVTLPTKGKRATLTPESMAAASVQYASGPLYLRLKTKFTGKQYATLMNDEEVPSYSVVDLDGGYNFGAVGFMKNTQLRVNLSNLGDKQYRNPSSGTVINAQAYGTVRANTVFYYLGAPNFVSVTLSGDFN